MLAIKPLVEDVAVSAQITAADFVEIAASGIRSIINNRPDNESDVPLSSSEVAELAAQHGLAYRAIPCIPSHVTDDDIVDAVGEALDVLPGPTLLYCRSGTRSVLLWAQAEASRGTADINALVIAAAQAGYDIGVIRDELEERAGRAAIRLAAE